jgi:hypothetical protein
MLREQSGPFVLLAYQEFYFLMSAVAVAPGSHKLITVFLRCLHCSLVCTFGRIRIQQRPPAVATPSQAKM